MEINAISAGTNLALFARARAYKLAVAATAAHLLWAGFECGEHIFLSPSGREVRVDLVIGKVTCEPGMLPPRCTSDV